MIQILFFVTFFGYSYLQLQITNLSTLLLMSINNEPLPALPSDQQSTNLPLQPKALEKTSLQEIIQASNTKRNFDSSQRQIKRPALIQANRNQDLFQNFPQLLISRVDSSEHREKQKSNIQKISSNSHLIQSVIQKPMFRTDSKYLSSSIEKPAINLYVTGKKNQNSGLSNIRQQPTYKKEGNPFAPNFAYGINSEDGSQNQNPVPSYRRINNIMTMQRMDMEISPKMVSSVISRESSGRQLSESKKNEQIYSSTLNYQSEKRHSQEAYDMYASRHPNDSIRRSTIQISKAISSNAITEMQKKSEIQDRKIKRLEKQVSEFKQSLKRWEQIKHKHQLEIESKTRQIFDLDSQNKKMKQQMEKIRSFRTMDTVQQVIISKLKEEVMQSNKKIIQMQAEHYKQKSLLQKQRKDTLKGQIDPERESVRKMQQKILTNLKQIQLLGVQLKKEKQRNWVLQKEKEVYLAEKVFQKQQIDNEAKSTKHQNSALREELIKIKQEQRVKQIEKKRLVEQNRKIREESSKKWIEKQQEWKQKLNTEMRKYELKLIQQQKNEYIKQKSEIQRLQSQKAIVQRNYKEKFQSLQSQISLVNQSVALKQQEIHNEYRQQLDQLRSIISSNQNYICQLENEHKKAISAIKEKDIQRYQAKSNALHMDQQEDQQIRRQQIVALQEEIRNKILAQITEEKESTRRREQDIERQKIVISEQLRRTTLTIESLKKQLIQAGQKLQVLSDQKVRNQKQIQDLTKSLNQIQKIKIELGQNQEKQKKIKELQLKIEASNIDLQKISEQHRAEISSWKSKYEQALQELSAQTGNRKALEKSIESEKVTRQEEIIKYEEMVLSCNSANNQLKTLRSQWQKLEQKCNVLQIENRRSGESVNTWKIKCQALQNSVSRIQNDLALMLKQRQQLKSTVAQLSSQKIKEIIAKYQELAPEYQILKQKLKSKEEQGKSRQDYLKKLKQQLDLGEQRNTQVTKQIIGLSNKVIDSQSKLAALLQVNEIQQKKHSQVYNKLVQDSQVYLAFIKKLQQDNEMIVQKYWKVRKLVKKQKINQQNDLLQKHDYSTFKQYVQQQYVSMVKKVLIPQFESKILQKISTYQISLANKEKKIIQIRMLLDQARRKKRREAEQKKIQ